MISHLHGFYVGNPSDPNIIQKGFFTGPKSIIALKLSLMDDWTFDRYYVQQNGSAFKKYYQNTFGGDITIDLFHRLNLSAFAGGNSINGTLYGLENQTLYFKTNHSYTGYVAAKLLALEWKNFSFGINGKIEESKSKLGTLSNNGVDITIPSNSRYKYNGWQAGLQGSYTLNFLIPYVGWYYYQINGKLINLPVGFSPTTEIKFSNKNRNGLVCGLSISSHTYFSFTAEARLFAELAVGTEVSMKF